MCTIVLHILSKISIWVQFRVRSLQILLQFALVCLIDFESQIAFVWPRENQPEI